MKTKHSSSSTKSQKSHKMQKNTGLKFINSSDLSFFNCSLTPFNKMHHPSLFIQRILKWFTEQWPWTYLYHNSEIVQCCWFIYLFGVLRRFQHCTGHITTGSWKGRGNQYIQFARVLYCKLPTNGKQLPAFPLKAMTGIEPQRQRWEARVLPLAPCNAVEFYIHCLLVYKCKCTNVSFLAWF